MRPSDFPFTTQDGRTVLSERCRCGATLHEHGVGSDGHSLGRGACSRTGCRKYEFQEFVVADVQKVAA